MTRGSGVVSVGGELLPLKFGDSCFVAAASEGVAYTPGTSGGELLLCRPTARA
jgi:hypothetical protein